MIIKRLVAPIAITSALVVLGSVTAGLIWARDQVPAVAPAVSESLVPGQEFPPVVEPHPMTGVSAAAETPLGPSAVLASFESGDGNVHQPASTGDDNLPTLPEKSELKYPNLGSSLDQLVATVEEGELSGKEAAEDAPLHQEESVAVTIYLSGNVDDVVKFLEDNGGSPRNVGEDYIEAYVPVSLLGQVSEQPRVIRVREIIPPEPAQGGLPVTG